MADPETIQQESRPAAVTARSGQYTIAVALVAALGGLMFGYDIGVIADAKTGIRKAFDVGDLTLSFVVSSVLAGSFIGALGAGRLADRIGRRWTNVWGGILFGIGCLGCALAVDITMIIAFRVLMGIGVGFSSVAGPLYIAEISAPWSRGAMVSLYQLAITIGIFLAFLVGLYTAPNGLWREAFGIGAALGIGLIVGMLVMPPSPRWLVGRGYLEIARGVLQRTMGSRSAAEEELRVIRRTVDQEKGQRLVTSIRTSRAVQLALILAIGLAFLQQASGINAIFYYGPEILTQVGLGDEKTLLQAGLGLVNVLATFIAIWLVDRLGRRPLLIAGTTLMMTAQIIGAICCGLLPEVGDASTGQDIPPAAVVILLSLATSIVAFAFSLGPLVWLVISEVFPSGVRSGCVGIATSVNWVGNFLIGSGAMIIIKADPAFAFWVFAGFNALTIVFVIWRMPETKGATLEDIEQFFTGRTPGTSGPEDGELG